MTPDFRPVGTTHDQALNMARHIIRQRLNQALQPAAQEAP
jgi:hypothetical protein